LESRGVRQTCLTPKMKTYMAKPTDVQAIWYIVDADAQIVGRLASRLAVVLMGKHKPTYTPHVDCGDFVVVVNAELVRFSGRKLAHPTHPNFTDKMLNKVYQRYTGYPSGQRNVTAAQMLERKPEHILESAVRRMLPKNKLGHRMIKKLKVYAGTDHPHQAQQPVPLPDFLIP
jgi:large subunit ribosomal protein L13